MKKNYCIFSAQFLPHMGGVERYTAHMAKELVKKGDQVTIVTTNPGRLPSIEKKEGCLICRMPSFPLMDGRFPIPRPGKEFGRLHRMLKNKKFDFVIVNARFYIHSLYGAVFGYAKHTKTIVIDHGSGHLTMGNPVLDWMTELFEHMITFVLKFFCKDFYGVSQASVKWLKHFGIHAKGTLHNAVDLPLIRQMLKEKGTDYRKAYHLSAETAIAAYTGRLLPEKGVLMLAEAIDRMASQGKEIALFLAGTGILEQKLKERHPLHVYLLGELSAPEVVSLLGQTDIFCLPSRSEGFSTSVLEAAACGCYIAVTKSACPRELLPDGRYAFILEDNTPSSIARALEYTLSHREDCRRAAKLAGGRLEKYFTWEQTVEKLRNLT